MSPGVVSIAVSVSMTVLAWGGDGQLRISGIVTTSPWGSGAFDATSFERIDTAQAPNGCAAFARSNGNCSSRLLHELGAQSAHDMQDVLLQALCGDEGRR